MLIILTLTVLLVLGVVWLYLKAAGRNHDVTEQEHVPPRH